MTKITEAVYTHGVLKPTADLDLREQQRVRVTVETLDEPHQDRAAALARLKAGIASMQFFSNGRLPTRAECMIALDTNVLIYACDRSNPHPKLATMDIKSSPFRLAEHWERIAAMPAGGRPSSNNPVLGGRPLLKAAPLEGAHIFRRKSEPLTTLTFLCEASVPILLDALGVICLDDMNGVRLTTELRTELLKHAHKRGYIFGQGKDGKPPLQTAISVAFGRLMREIGLEGVTHHVLRHTGASAMVAAGISLRVVQDIGGWSTLRMLERYAHPSGADMARAVRVLTAYTTGTKTGTAQKTDSRSSKGRTRERVGKKVLCPT